MWCGPVLYVLVVWCAVCASAKGWRQRDRETETRHHAMCISVYLCPLALLTLVAALTRTGGGVWCVLHVVLKRWRQRDRDESRDESCNEPHPSPVDPSPSLNPLHSYTPKPTQPKTTTPKYTPPLIQVYTSWPRARCHVRVATCVATCVHSSLTNIGEYVCPSFFLRYQLATCVHSSLHGIIVPLGIMISLSR